jgi:hypothetical protein
MHTNDQIQIAKILEEMYDNNMMKNLLQNGLDSARWERWGDEASRNQNQPQQDSGGEQEPDIVPQEEIFNLVHKYGLKIYSNGKEYTIVNKNKSLTMVPKFNEYQISPKLNDPEVMKYLGQNHFRPRIGGIHVGSIQDIERLIKTFKNV